MFNLEDTYNQAIKITQNIVEDIRFGRKLYLSPVKICSMQICKYMNEDTEVLTLLNNVRDKNPYLYAHPVNVAFLSMAIGKWLNLDYRNLVNLVRTALLHDIGKAKIRDSLLNKSDTLSFEELEKMKTHPVISYKILKSTNEFDADVLKGVLFHHERLDGTGYPLGIKGDKIHLYARIIAIADTYDAITATRKYGVKNLPLKAAEEIQTNSAKNLDPNICRIFVSKVIDYYHGREIRLSNDQVGNIVYINPIEIAKPLVCCANVYYDLAVEKDIEIVELL
jgi:HD-GYP domain-containing protein (c-di-GMP phosphodiesterase class II)